MEEGTEKERGEEEKEEEEEKEKEKEGEGEGGERMNMCLGMFLLGFILYGTLRFLDLIDYFLSHIREVFN